MKMLFIFVDGIGLRPASADNPINAEICPTLCRLIAEHSVAIDACLDMEGLPQSATGQASMFTGVNAAQFMGRHCEGFPGPSLRKLLGEDNLFMALRRKGIRCRFADAYMVESVDELVARRFKSVTTVMALTQPETISTQEDLRDKLAVTHDITGEVLVKKGHAVKPITPLKAAEHLLQVVRAYDFTLFEIFQTDFAGHSSNFEEARLILKTLDQFLDSVEKLCVSAGILLVITSDHGNIEDMSVRGHTRNPVPLIALGPEAPAFLAHARSLTDITPRIISMFH
jgi:2,3-bisphosphoglycerate-independent phosphoglycerate mutase